MKTMLATCGLMLVLSGCATQNAAGTSSYKAVPSAQVLASVAEPGPSEPAGTIIVKRDPGMMGFALSSTLLVDGKPVARIGPGQYIQFRAPVGEHLFGVSWSDNLGAVATSSTRELAVNIQPGQTYYFRMFPQIGAGILIERSSQ